MTNKYFRLLRVKHYIKNLLIFFPIFFGRAFFDTLTICRAITGFVVFSAIASAVYILNDIKDAERDRIHPVKRFRPIASGEIKRDSALVIAILLLAVATFLTVYMTQAPLALPDTSSYYMAVVLLFIYVIINICYSRGAKNIPILDVAILAAGYVIRVYYGGLITGIEVSDWLFLVITAGAAYMGLGKRRGELLRYSDTREVLKSYSKEFLNGSMTLMMGLTIVFYALWARDIENRRMIFSVPLFMIIMLRYSMVSDKKADGDPVEVILSDPPILGLLVLYGIVVSLMIYI